MSNCKSGANAQLRCQPLKKFYYKSFPHPAKLLGCQEIRGVGRPGLNPRGCAARHGPSGASFWTPNPRTKVNRNVSSKRADHYKNSRPRVAAASPLQKFNARASLAYIWKSTSSWKRSSHYKSSKSGVVCRALTASKCSSHYQK